MSLAASLLVVLAGAMPIAQRDEPRAQHGADAPYAERSAQPAEPVPRFAPWTEGEIHAALVRGGDAELACWIADAPGLAVLALERELLAGDPARVERALALPEARATLHAASCEHARRLERLALAPAVAREIARAAGAGSGTDASERELATRVAALEAAGATLSARVAELDVLTLLADENRPAELADLCRTILARDADDPLLAFTRGAVGVRLAEALRATQQPSLAELQAALAFLREHPDAPALAFATDQLGWCHTVSHRFDDALDAFRESVEVARRIGDVDRRIRATRSAGNVLSYMGFFEEAVAAIEGSIRLARAHDISLRELESTLHLAGVLFMSGDLRAAERTTARAGALAAALPEVPLRLHVQRLRMLARTELAHGAESLSAELAAELEHCTPRLGAAHERVSPATLLAWHWTGVGAPERALECLESIELDADSSKGTRIEAFVMQSLAELALGRYDAAMESTWIALRQRNAARRAMTDVGLEPRLRYQVGTARVTSIGVRSAFRAWETTGDERYARHALAFLDHGRMRSLREALAERGTGAHLAPRPYEPTEDPIARAGLAPDEVLLALDLDAGVAIAIADGALRLWSVPTSAELADRVALLGHVLFEEPDAAVYARVAEPLSRELLGPVRERLREPGTLVVLSDGPLLDLPLDWLFAAPPPTAPADASALPFLFRHRRIVHAACLPDARAARLAADARARPSASPPPAGGPRLAHRGMADLAELDAAAGSMERLPIAAVDLAGSRRSDPPPWSLLAFVHDGRDGELAGVRAEVAELARLFGPAHAEVHAGAEATEARFRELVHPRARVLHLAGHVVADRRRGADSHLRLAPDGGASGGGAPDGRANGGGARGGGADGGGARGGAVRGGGADGGGADGGGTDGELTTAELLDLALDYELAVVAACEGAAGQPVDAEGRLSFGWGLLAAGARHVVLSPTPVDDLRSRRWMAAFYRELLRGGDPAEALRSTRVALLASADPEDRAAALLPFHLLRGPR